MKKVLLVEDDEAVRRLIERALKNGGYSVISAADGSTALLLAQESRPDLVLSDAEMPGLDGHALCRTLRRTEAFKALPVILMSGAMKSDGDIVSGLSGGADDYILKPIAPKVLLARIEAVLRRYAPAAEAVAAVERSGIRVDPESHGVIVAGKKIVLSRKEFDLLSLFLSKPDKILKANYLLETVWGYDLADYNDPHTVESHLSSLRRKLGAAAAKRLVNVRGVGYKFETGAV